MIAILFAFFSHLLHEADIVILGQVSILKEIGAIVRGHRLDQMLDDFVGDERMAEVKLSHVGLENMLVIRTRYHYRHNPTYLSIGNFLETLEDLLGRVLILGHTDHKPDELFEAHAGIL